MKLFSRLFAAAIAGVMLVGSAFAGNIEARFGNTVVATNPDGSTTKFYYNADKTFTVKAEMDGRTLLETEGTWRQDGDKLCLTVDATFGPFEAGKERCVPLMGDKVGDTWQTPSKDAQGNDVMVTVTIAAGR